MSATVTAAFDRRSDAEAARDRLRRANVDSDRISILDEGGAGTDRAARSTLKDLGLWRAVRNAFLPEQDRRLYEEVVRRGGFVLTADVDEGQVEDAVRVLEAAGSIDVDERSRRWSGWAEDGAADGAGRDRPAGDGAEQTHGSGSKRPGEGERILPVVGKDLVVGRREAGRGGVRVRSYVTDTPVHEQLRLREERIDVQRRPADRAVTGADDAFRERAIDVSATGEEAVVGKTARVVEEVVVSKTAYDRVEQIDDVVRRTDVEFGRSGEASGRREGAGVRLSGSDPVEVGSARSQVAAGTAPRADALGDQPVFAKAVEVFGSVENAEEFFRSPALGLDNRRPIDLVASEDGVAAVTTLLERVLHGVYV